MQLVSLLVLLLAPLLLSLPGDVGTVGVSVGMVIVVATSRRRGGTKCSSGLGMGCLVSVSLIPNGSESECDS